MTTLQETDPEHGVELCTICRKPKLGHNYHHQFSSPGSRTNGLVKSSDAPSAPSVQSEGSVRIPSGGDPMLRMVLLRKGLITVADLDEVEAELRATGVAGYEPPQTLG